MRRVADGIIVAVSEWVWLHNPIAQRRYAKVCKAEKVAYQLGWDMSRHELGHHSNRSGYFESEDVARMTHEAIGTAELILTTINRHRGTSHTFASVAEAVGVDPAVVTIADGRKILRYVGETIMGERAAAV